MRVNKLLLILIVLISIPSFNEVLSLYPKPVGSPVLERNLKRLEDVILDRDSIFDEMRRLLALKDSKVVALVGAGGAGKTTLARLHLKKCHEEQPGTIAFELNAETEESLYNSLINTFSKLVKTDEDKKGWSLIQKASNQKDKNQHLLNFVRKKLKTKKWILLFDGVENLDLVMGIFPSNSELYRNGKVLVTTRNQNIESLNVLNKKWLRVINVGELTDVEKYKLFMLVVEKSTDRRYEKGEVEKFLEDIPDYPLDIVSVACYLGSYGISLKHYQEKMKMMTEEFNRQMTYSDNRYGIVAITLQKILDVLENKEIYKNLLLLISMCNAQDIPVKLLEKCGSLEESVRLLSELRRHSFITIDNGKISIHRSIQEIWFQILKNQVDETNLDIFMNTFFDKAANIKEANSLYYKVKYDKRDREWLNIICHHVECISNKIESLDISIEKRNEYVSRLSFLSGIIYERQSGNMNKAIKLYEKLGNKCYDLPKYERAVFLSEVGRAISHIDLDSGYNFIKEGIEIASTLTDAEPLMVMLLLRLGDIQIRQGEFDTGVETIKKSVSLIPMNGETWSDKLYIEINSAVSLITLFKHFNDKKMAKEYSINETIKMLKMLNGDRLFSKGKLPTTVSGFILHLRRNLVVIYNIAEEYSKVEEIYKDTKFIYEKLSGMSTYMYLYICMEYGVSLLRLGELKKATEMIAQTLLRMEDNNFTIEVRLIGIAALSEVEIRLKKYVESLNTALKAIHLSKKFKDNMSKFNYSKCLYNAAFASYKLDKLDDAKGYFEACMKNVRELCRDLISADDLKNLEDEGAFNEQSDIKTYLLNAYKIYAKILDKDHAFVKDYVYKNL